MTTQRSGLDFIDRLDSHGQEGYVLPAYNVPCYEQREAVEQMSANKDDGMQH